MDDRDAPVGSTRDAAMDGALPPLDMRDEVPGARDGGPAVEAAADAARVEPSGTGDDAASPEPPRSAADAGSQDLADASRQLPTADAAVLPLCSSADVLCDDFEGVALVCSNERVGKWNSCERLGSAPDPVIVAGTGTHGRVLLSSPGAEPDTRGARVALDLPVDVGHVYVAFDFLPQPGDNPYYTWVKLERGSGPDQSGVLTHYSGVSLISQAGKLALAVQTTYDLRKPDLESITELRAMPTAWTRVALDVTIGAAQVDVSVQFDEGAPLRYGPFARDTVVAQTMQLLLGVYSGSPGNTSILYDNVVVR